MKPHSSANTSLRAASRQGLSRLTQIATLVLIATVLAMSIAMGTMIWQRRPRLARMKVQGYERGVLWRALLCESCLLLGAGCLIGAACGIYGQLLISHALATVTGFPIVFSAGALVALVSFALVSVRGGGDRRAAGLSRCRRASIRVAARLLGRGVENSRVGEILGCRSPVLKHWVFAIHSIF